MRCIFCLEERPGSIEHVFPLAIGGTPTADRVCQPCNSTQGSRTDSALCDFLPVRQRRAELELAGNAKAPPAPLEMLTGIASLAGQPEERIATRYDAATGKLDHRLLHQVADVVTLDGKRFVRSASMLGTGTRSRKSSRGNASGMGCSPCPIWNWKNELPRQCKT